MNPRRNFLSSTAAGLFATNLTKIAYSQPTLPKVRDQFKLAQRSRQIRGNRSIIKERTASWLASETAIIVCDMWAEHPCKIAQYRADRMATRMNEVISWARDHGAAIIHAPSGGVMHYEGTPYRQRMIDAPQKTPPAPIQGWCYHNPDKEGKWPIVDDIRRAEGAVTGCDDPTPKAHKDHDRHQNSKIRIIGYDGVSDNGQEIYNFLEQEGRDNIVLMGVHTNMCVLGRPFGIRQQCYLGKNVVLCRDLTDALYDPRDPPHVSHARGLELVIHHIEQYWCPTILGKDLLTANT